MKLNIEELALEANLNAGKAAKFRSDRGQTMTVPEQEELQRLEAFARLIVERCAQACEQTEDGEGPDCWDWHSKDYARAIRNLMED